MMIRQINQSINQSINAAVDKILTVIVVFTTSCWLYLPAALFLASNRCNIVDYCPPKFEDIVIRDDSFGQYLSEMFASSI